MNITTKGDFPGTCDEVFSLLSDEEFQRSIGGGPGSGATVAASGDRTVITSVRVLPTDGMPDVAKTFVGDTLRLREVQDWGPPASDGSRSGTLTLTVEGAPLRLVGSLRLAPSGAGSTQSVDADLTAKVPLVGGRIEQAAAPAVTDAIQAEYALIRQRLRG